MPQAFHRTGGADATRARNDHQPTSIEAIAAQISREFGVKLSALQSASRSRSLVRARAELARRVIYADVGRAIDVARFTNRSLATVCRSLQRWEPD